MQPIIYPLMTSTVSFTLGDLKYDAREKGWCDCIDKKTLDNVFVAKDSKLISGIKNKNQFKF